MGEVNAAVPRGNLQGLFRYAGNDLLAGFLVFLIALPLCLGIALASDYPAMAGVFTAIIGGIVATVISNSELTIKGPAAGLIVIALGCVTEFRAMVHEDSAVTQAFHDSVADDTAYQNADAQTQAARREAFDKYRAYRMALGVGVAAAVLQILFGALRTGVLGEFFPTAAVHGMLAAIGIIIAAKQFNISLGVNQPGGPFAQIAAIPDTLLNLNPAVAAIGALSLVIMFGYPLIRNRLARLIPPQMIVLVIAIALGMAFGLGGAPHNYALLGHEYPLSGKRFLVDVPNNFFSAFALPDFSGLVTATGWKFVIMFALVGSLESLLSAKAIDLIDPFKRRTNLNRDLLAIGAGNLLSACVGGLPMISEIVRSKANLDNGARTRFADLYHSLCLLVFVALFPWLIQMIPLAALAAMLVYTGFRLASPKEWVHVYLVGQEQLIVFASTVVATLATDLLIGIAVGIGVEILIHLVNYAPFRSLLFGDATVEQTGERTYVVRVRHAAVFSNWIALKRKIDRLPPDADVTVDLAETHLVDHTVMEKLHELERDFEREHRHLHVRGLEQHVTYSDHPKAARKKTALIGNGSAVESNGYPNAMLDHAAAENATT
jgi:MFS superfamily sulfate permease-like transporter